MKILCVTAQRSNLGKTVLSERLLKRLDNWAACKVTICTDGPHACPRGKKDCGACGSLEADYAIETDRRIIAREGKDTYRLLKAGAKRVFWVKAKEPFIKEALDDALARLRGFDGVLLEGNGSLKALKPTLSVMVISSGGGTKKSARDIRNRVDMFIDDANDCEVVEWIVNAVKTKAQK